MLIATIAKVSRDETLTSLKLKGLSSDCPSTIEVETSTFYGLKSDKIYFDKTSIGEVLKRYSLEPSTDMEDIAWYFFPSVKWVFRLEKEGVTFDEFSKNMCTLVETKDVERFMTWSGYSPDDDTIIVNNTKTGEPFPPKSPKQLFQVWKTKYIDRIPRMYGFWHSDIVNTRFGLYRNLELFRFNPWAFHTLDEKTIEKIPAAHRVPFGREIYEIVKKLPMKIENIPKEYHEYLDAFFVKVIDDIAYSETQLIVNKHIISLSNEIKLPEIKFEDDPKLNVEQNAAVRHFCQYKYTLVTGGAGVGKTRTIKKIIDILQNEPKKEREGWLVAIAGKAVQRIKEVVGQRDGCYYATIHSAINNLSTVCLDPHFIIIDEISMCSLEELSGILEKLPPGSRLAMFGDSNQLFPVEGQNIFQFDFVDLETKREHIPIQPIELKQCYRSTKGILNLCNEILDGTCSMESRMPYFMYQNSLDYDMLINFIEMLSKNELKFQVITPYVEETEKITKLLKRRKKIDGFGFFSGEKILVRKNLFSVNNRGLKRIVLANGEIGRYIGSGEFEINDKRFSVKEVSVISGEALTIHKVQGSEFDVVLYWNPRNTSFITKELVYTAFSRAKSKLILFGERYCSSSSVNSY